MCISIIHNIYDITNIMLITSSHPPHNMTYWEMAVTWPLTLLLSHLCEPGKQGTWESHLISHCLSSNFTCQTSHDTSPGWPGLWTPSFSPLLSAGLYPQEAAEGDQESEEERETRSSCLPPATPSGRPVSCLLPPRHPAESVHSHKASKHSLRLFSATGQASSHLSLSQVPAQK